MSVQPQIWQRFGDVNNFVDPFFGGGSSLWGNPKFDWKTGNWAGPATTETVNDIDGWVANFWRAVKHDAPAVAEWADNPVNENDLHARHIWLVNTPPDVERLNGEPDYYDAKKAGWWVWGICAWIGSGWCSGKGPWQSVDGRLVKGNGMGINRQRPHLGNNGMGINRQLPHLGDNGRGINRKLPHLGSNGMGQAAQWAEWLQFYFGRIQDRLRRVRVCSGDWTRVLGPTPTEKLGVTAILLDPPYAATDRELVYNEDSRSVAGDVMAWAIANGDNPMLRIALCGYEADYQMPSGWETWHWKAAGGYENQSDDPSGNRHREVIWFSPHCARAPQQTSFQF